ncbi:MAG: galactose oxidase [Gammaproteobacteria bacterium]|nr:galactose oxidase [Gammaproteobacteria bacterium]
MLLAANQTLPALPVPVTNNAVAMVTIENGAWLMSFGGLAEGKQWHDTLAHTYVLAPGADQWQRKSTIPDGRGRLAAVAVAVNDSAYVFGGYTVAADHSEVSLPYAHRYDPRTDHFERLSDMPVPVDDAVAVTYSQRYIYLVSGWHDKGNVNLVQMYDIQEDLWAQATPYPGNPVFGHAGGIVANQMVICDGVKIRIRAVGKREFVMDNACFAGTIDQAQPRTIDWRPIHPHPGKPRYRMAAGGSSTFGGVLFAGGSTNPYNYNGIGYNGEPAEPESGFLLFDVTGGNWRHAGSMAMPSMDHRGLLIDAHRVITVGGMHAAQQVTPRVQVFGYQGR